MQNPKIVMLLFVTSVSIQSFGSTVSRDVVDTMGYLQELIRKPMPERVVDIEDPGYETFIKILDGKKRPNSSIGATSMACLYFAWADDELSLERLKQYAKADIISGLHSFVGGSALYALTMRNLKGRSTNETKLLLSYTLGKIENDYQKMFIANRLWVDYKDEVLPVILLTAKDTSTKFAIQEYLFLLSHSDDTRILTDALALNLRGAVEVYDWNLVMSAATPGRSTHALDNSPYVFIKKMQSKLEKLNQP